MSPVTLGIDGCEGQMSARPESRAALRAASLADMHWLMGLQDTQPAGRHRSKQHKVNTGPQLAEPIGPVQAAKAPMPRLLQAALRSVAVHNIVHLHITVVLMVIMPAYKQRDVRCNVACSLQDSLGMSHWES